MITNNALVGRAPNIILIIMITDEDSDDAKKSNKCFVNKFSCGKVLQVGV